MLVYADLSAWKHPLKSLDVNTAVAAAVATGTVARPSLAVAVCRVVAPAALVRAQSPVRLLDLTAAAARRSQREA